MLNRFSGGYRFHLLIASALAFLLLNVASGFSADIKLAWDPNTEADLAGYKVYYGTSPRTGTDPKSCGTCGYTSFVPVGNVTAYTANNLAGGQTYYFSVTASDLSQNESGFSNEVSGTAGVTVQPYTFATNPTGLQITVDGTTYTAPQTFNWSPGSSHTLSVASPQGGTGTRYLFSSWSDGGAQNHSVTVPSSGTTYTANFTVQYSLTTSVSPSGVGTVSPSGMNWYNSGQIVPVSGSPNTGYNFSSWTGDLTGSTNPASLTMGGPKSVTANFTQNQYTLTVSVNPSGAGSVTKSPSKTTYLYGDQVTLTAGTGNGYTFSSWSGDASGTAPSATITINGNKAVTANFTAAAGPQTYTVSSNLPGLQVYVDDTAYSTPQSFQWVPGSSHKLFAPSPQKPTQSSRYNFQSWSDSGSQTHTISAPGTGTTYEAKYKTQNKIRVTVSPTDAGTVSLSSSKQSQSGATSTVLSTEDWYDDDDTVTLTASANSGYNFSGWAGDLSGKDNSVKTQMNNPKEVVANFVVATETVSTPNLPSGPGNGGPGTSYSYATAGAVSSQGHAVEYQFDWKGDGTDLSPWGAATQSKTWATVGAYQVKARARCVTDPTVVSNWSSGLSVVVTQSGVSCTVATNPSGLQITVDGSNYTAPQVFNWAPGSSHTVLVASPLSGGPGTQYAYLSWSDGGGQSHTVTVPPSNTTYTANFTAQYSLTTSVTPSGGGTVSPSGVCWYNSGQSVSVSASPNPGYSFSSWTGDLTGSTNPASLMMSGPKSVTANFSAPSANLVVTPVTGLSASGLQGGPFSPASQVFTVLNNGGVGGNWSVSKSQDWLSLSSSGGPLGPGMSASLTFAFNASANTLAPGTYTDTITFKDQDGGNTIGFRSVVLVVYSAQSGYTVTSDPPGLFVMVDGMTYRAPYTFDWPSGSSHALSVSSLPQPGFSGTQYIFGRWNDGGSQSHVITASPAAKIYLASFDTQYSLTLFASPPEGGKANPSGTTWFNAGETVSLSASANEGYSFAGWSGDTSGTQNPAVILMDKARLVTATFSGGTSSLTVNAVLPTSGNITKSPDKTTYTTGEQVSLTAAPNPGYIFKNWSGDLTGETNPVTVTVKGNMTVTANFVPLASFDVTPLGGLNISGRQGGTFDPTGQTYTLKNSSGKLLKWKVTKKPRWLTAAPASGTLAPGDETQVVMSIVSSVKQLKPGSYSDAIVIGNTANKADSLSRAVTLTVQPALKTYSVKTNPDGLEVKIDGVAYASPQMLEWEVGSSHQLEISSPQGGAPGVQYVFSSWSNRKSQNQTIVAPAAGGTFTATFKTQYNLTTSAGSAGGGTVVPSGAAWFDQGQKITVKAIPSDGFQFLNWSGDLSGATTR